MEFSTKKIFGSTILLIGLPAIAQEVTALKANAVAACASCPAGLQAPPGPIIWFAIGTAFGFALALVAFKFLAMRKEK
jgi:asparagine N-glycosylation enzyme membrane subunit Stt3